MEMGGAGAVVFVAGLLINQSPGTCGLRHRGVGVL